MPPEDIQDSDLLYRRVPKVWIKENGKPSSAAFQNQVGTTKFSVNLARLSSPKQAALFDRSYGVVSFDAGFARQCRQKVFHDAEIGNYAHSTVSGEKTKSIRKKFAEAAQVVLFPDWS